jgi:hypothetical protein
MNVKTVLLNRVIEEEAYVEKPQGFEVYHPYMQMEEDVVWIQANLVQSLSCIAKAW